MTGIARDLTLIAVAAAASVALGLLTNRLRPHPLPLVYRGPEARLMGNLPPRPPTAPEPETIGFAEAWQAWTDGNARFVDARASDFFEEGHIPGAVNLPRELLTEGGAQPELLGKSQPLIVYCSGEDCEDSLLVAKGLLALGYLNVTVFPGGWEEWEAKGGAAEK